MFLAFQYPVEIPGVANMYFLRQAHERAAQGARRGRDRRRRVPEAAARARPRWSASTEELLKRDLNVGFSGGEKKRNEILQMAMLEPRLCILDETDSGLDIDALRTVADGVNALREPERGIIVITHYQRLLDYIVPDQVHVLADGRIRRSGGKELALELEAGGYAGVLGASSPSSGRGPEAMATARSARSSRCRPSAPCSPSAQAQLPGAAAARLAAGAASRGSWRWASRPPGPRPGSTPTSRRAAQRAAGAGAPGRARPGRDRAAICWAATRRGG